jgi:hypothetical protein
LKAKQRRGMGRFRAHVSKRTGSDALDSIDIGLIFTGQNVMFVVVIQFITAEGSVCLGSGFPI